LEVVKNKTSLETASGFSNKSSAYQELANRTKVIKNVLTLSGCDDQMCQGIGREVPDIRTSSNTATGDAAVMKMAAVE